MVFRRFRLAIVTRVLLLSLSILLVFYLVFSTSMYATIAIVILAIVIQIVSLVSYVESSNRDMGRFLESLEFSDYSQTFTRGLKGSSFDELNEAFSKVMGRFREIRMQKEENFRYLQTVVQHVGIGMIAFTSEGQVELLNTAAKRLFDVASMKSIEEIEDISPELARRLKTIGPGHRDLITVTCNSVMMQLSIHATELRLRHKKITLVSLQNISNELDEKEMEAWQNLIRVLTHEIKNSLTPIASLASTVESLIIDEEGGAHSVMSDDIGDIRDALQTIQKRSRGLQQFVDSYRDLTHLPQPTFATFPIKDLINRIEKFILPQLEKHKVAFESTVEPDNLALTADAELVEQVLINLLLNSKQALGSRKDGRIELVVGIDERGRTNIRVSDNGPGIVREAQEKVFVPFYTTKKGGSGIGLSLSRQIMRLHRGDLTVESVPDQETHVTMRF